MTASERKKRCKRSRVLIYIWEWCGKDVVIGNCKMPAVNDKNYAFNQRFLKFIYVAVLHTRSDCLFSKFFLSACLTDLGMSSNRR